nr:hypothetical protein [Tanacetum cinerariifolium]
QTTTGKEISNPFMAGSLPKPKLLTFIHVNRLQALIDKKKVVVAKATIREALRLDDEEGVECLPNEEIFAELARMGYEKPSTKLTFYKAFFSSQWKFLIHTILQCMSAKRNSWNEFSSSMAYAVICLSSGRKFNFSKYIFDSLVRNVNSLTKFYMYPHFLQLMIKKQVGDLLTHTTKYTSLALTQKVFANMRRVGKGFSGVETPLFESMLVKQQVAEEGDADENVKEVNAGDAAEGDVSAAHEEVPTIAKELSILSLIPPSLPPQPSQDIPLTSQEHPTPLQSPQVLEDVKEAVDEAKEVAKDAKVDESVDIQGRQGESQAEIYKIDLDHANKVLSMQEDETEPTEVQEVVDVVTTAKLITEVVTVASETITAASVNITAAEAQVPTVTLTAAPIRVTATPSRRMKGDKGKGILVEEPKPLKKKQQIEQDEQYARELHAELNKNIDWDEVINHVKIKAKEDPAVKKYQALKRKPQTKAQARKNMIDEFPLPEQLPTANEDKFPLLIQSDATAEELCAAAEVNE